MAEIFTTEAEKIRARVLPLLEGVEVLDIGCGSKKVVPWALSVDSMDSRADHKANVDASSGELKALLGDRLFQVVFSSHCLEHMRSPIVETIRHWLSFVKPGGHLILYLPDETAYQYNPGVPWLRNPEHHHLLTLQTFTWYANQVQGVEFTIEPDINPSESRYSFLCVMKKIGP
jgi:predicted SAM-dependent methyltransferase